MNVGQPEVTTLVGVGEAFVIETEAVEQGGLEQGGLDVVDMDGIFDDVESQIIGGPVYHSRFDPASSQP